MELRSVRSRGNARVHCGCLVLSSISPTHVMFAFFDGNNPQLGLGLKSLCVLRPPSNSGHPYIFPAHTTDSYYRNTQVESDICSVQNSSESSTAGVRLLSPRPKPSEIRTEIPSKMLCNLEGPNIAPHGTLRKPRKPCLSLEQIQPRHAIPVRYTLPTLRAITAALCRYLPVFELLGVDVEGERVPNSAHDVCYRQVTD